MRGGRRTARLAAAGLLVGVVALVARPASAAAQASPGPRFHATGYGGVSLRENLGTLRVGRDLVTYGLRLAVDRGGLRPWAQVDRFTRPGLECVPELPCNDNGWVVRVGTELPFVGDPGESIAHPYLTAGIGAGFSEETTFAYILGFGIHWSLARALGPLFEARWEQVPGLRAVVTLNAGLRLSL